MSITINEMTITVPGNVVKTFSEDGKNSNLRITQAQAQSLYDQLGPVLAYFAAQANGDNFQSLINKGSPDVKQAISNIPGAVFTPKDETVTK